MVIVVRVARVLLLCVIALLTLSFVMSVGASEVGAFEKVVLLCLIGGCVYAAVKVSALADWAARRLARH